MRFDEGLHGRIAYVEASPAHGRPKQIVAVLKLPRSLDSADIEEHRREAELHMSLADTAAVRNGYVVRPLAFTTVRSLTNEVPALVLEYVGASNAASLDDKTSKAPCTTARARACFEALHAEGTVHGDVSMYNLLVPRPCESAAGSADQLKLADLEDAKRPNKQDGPDAIAAEWAEVLKMFPRASHDSLS